MSTLDQSNSCLYNSKSIDTNPYITQLLLIQEQTQLMEEIAFKKSKKNNRESRILTTQISDISFQIPTHPHFLDVSMSCTDIRKNISLTNIPQPELERALREIGSKCSIHTFSLIRNKLTGNSDRRFQLKLQKQKRHNAELTSKIAKLNERLMEYEMKYDSVSSQYNNLKQQEISSKKKIIDTEKSVIDKERKFLKWETSLIYKQKMISTAQKKIEKQLQLIDEQKMLNEKISKSIEQFLKNKNSNVKNNLISNICESIKAKQNMLDKKQQCIIEHYKEIQAIVSDTRKHLPH